MLESLHNETNLVERAIAGDAEAFGGLYALHLEAIYRYIAARVGNTSDAEDLTEQVFLKAWEALPGYEQRESRFTSWLYRIAHNLVIDHYRLQRRTIPVSLLETGDWDTKQPTTLDKIIADEESTALARAVERLPEEQKRVIFLRFVEGLNHTEIARVLDKSKGACRVIQHRALTALNHMLNSTLSIILALLLLLGGTVFASQRALPGTLLYPVKRAIETMQLAVAPDAIASTNLRLAFAGRRLDEVATLLQQNRAEHIEQALRDYTAQFGAILAIFDQEHTVSAAEQIATARLLITTQAHQETRLTTLLNRAPESAYASLEAALATTRAARDRAQAVINEGREPIPPPPEPTATPTPPLPSATASPDAAASSAALQPPVPTVSPPPAAPPIVPPTATLPPPVPSPASLPPAAIPTSPPPPTVAPPSVTPVPLPPTATPTAQPPSATPAPPSPTATPVVPSPTATSTQPLPSPTPTLTPQRAPVDTILGDAEVLPLPPVPEIPTLPDLPDPPDPPDLPNPPDPPDPPDLPDPPDPPDLPNPPDPPDPPDLSDPPDLPDLPDLPPPPLRSDSSPIEYEQSASRDTLPVSATLTYTITLWNDNAADVTITLIDQLPRVVTYVAGSAVPEGVYISEEVHALLWEEVIVPAGGELVISFQVTAQAVKAPTPAVNMVLIIIDDATFSLDPLLITVVPNP